MIKLASFKIILPFLFSAFLAYSCTSRGVNKNKEISSSEFFKFNPDTENLGKYVTSVGQLRTLIIFAKFSDDNDSINNSWNSNIPKLPAWSKKMINSSNALNFPENNLTQYFYEMSSGNLMLYGDIYPNLVVPKFSQSDYKSIAEVNYEILSELDAEIDFSKYDNWKKGKDQKYVNEPDGQVDVIFIVYRNFENRLFFNNGWTAAAHLYLSKEISTNDGVKIAKGRLDTGSGIQSRGARHGFEYLKYVLAHEFGHLLFGSGHIENVTNLALMTGGPVWNASRGMHSWEREKLGWLRFKDIPININSSIIINDYFTFNEAYRLKLSDREWFVIENHQGISPNDKARDKGVYIYKIENAERFAPKISVKCADGNWDFQIDTENKKLLKTTPNRTGKTEMNFRKRISGKNYACYQEVYEDNSAWGDEFDAFDKEYNNLLSPLSAPSSQNNENAVFALFVKNQKNKTYELDILFDQVYENTPPSKPQVIGMDINQDSAVLSWLPNLEPDLRGYNVYYSDNRIDVQKPFEKINNEDLNTASDISSLLGNKDLSITICVTAFDSSGMESVISDFIELSFDDKNKNWEWRRVEQY